MENIFEQLESLDKSNLSEKTQKRIDIALSYKTLELDDDERGKIKEILNSANAELEALNKSDESKPIKRKKRQHKKKELSEEQQELRGGLNLPHEQFFQDEGVEASDLPKKIRQKLTGMKMFVGRYLNSPSEKLKASAERASEKLYNILQEWKNGEYEEGGEQQGEPNPQQVRRRRPTRNDVEEEIEEESGELTEQQRRAIAIGLEKDAPLYIIEAEEEKLEPVAEDDEDEDDEGGGVTGNPLLDSMFGF